MCIAHIVRILTSTGISLQSQIFPDLRGGCPTFIEEDAGELFSLFFCEAQHVTCGFEPSDACEGDLNICVPLMTLRREFFLNIIFASLIRPKGETSLLISPVV